MRVQLVVAAGLVLLAIAATVVVPLLPGPIRPANLANACSDPGQVGAQIFDSTDLARPWFKPHPVCPLTFSEMFVLAIRRPDSTDPPDKNPLCVRNIQEVECDPGTQEILSIKPRR
jgi:hypothetical protein